jgi:hypothetical protein
LIGGIIGFILFFLLSLFLMHINGSLKPEVAMNPFLGPPPMFVATLLGFVGFVIGALSSLFTNKWNKFS